MTRDSESKKSDRSLLGTRKWLEASQERLQERFQQQLSDLAATERMIYRALPRFMMEIARRYFRLEVEGLEHIPRRGAGIIAPNHSGYSGFDAFLLANEIHRSTGRLPRILTHHFWFLTKATAIPAEKVGFVEATTQNGRDLLKRNNLIVLFPEGEHGNFKPTTKRYHLQEFKRGFVRLAIERQCPIIPVLIIGAEETH
ncbi:MAG: lysophospholipid acyltransferase family protein, partial [Bdellovibrionales bacterium]|nr:lysophospholipid acyltransferase family protein [Bdellovibrionales bacterium]